LDQAGLVNSIVDAVIHIDIGRKGFATWGREQEGRISYERGISKAFSTFEKAQSSADPQTIIIAEYTFISQELQLCSEADKDKKLLLAYKHIKLILFHKKQNVNRKICFLAYSVNHGFQGKFKGRTDLFRLACQGIGRPDGPQEAYH
jgi:hypothetical protein